MDRYKSKYFHFFYRIGRFGLEYLFDIELRYDYSSSKYMNL